MRKKIDYSIILLERLKNAGDKPVDVKAVAREFNLPPAFLEKVAQELKRVGWVESQKGRGGGDRISKMGEIITMADIINFFERPQEICPVLRIKNQESRNYEAKK